MEIERQINDERRAVELHEARLQEAHEAAIDNLQQIDEDMDTAVNLALKALQHNSEDALLQLTAAIDKARNCFQRWGLISETLQHHMQLLKEEGALAVKPTGSGSGGHVLSLWQTPVLLQSPELIAV